MDLEALCVYCVICEPLKKNENKKNMQSMFVFFCLKARLIEPALGGPLFCGCGASIVDMDTLSPRFGAWYQVLCSTHVKL